MSNEQQSGEARSVSTKATAIDTKSGKTFGGSEKTDSSQPNGSIFLFSSDAKATCIRYAITNQVALKNSNPIEPKTTQKKLSSYQEIMR